MDLPELPRVASSKVHARPITGLLFFFFFFSETPVLPSHVVYPSMGHPRTIPTDSARRLQVKACELNMDTKLHPRKPRSKKRGFTLASNHKPLIPTIKASMAKGHCFSFDRSCGVPCLQTLVFRHIPHPRAVHPLQFGGVDLSSSAAPVPRTSSGPSGMEILKAFTCPPTT